MNTTLALIVSLTFVMLALWHFDMVLSPSGGMSGAVPSESGKPLFVPSVRATLAVGVVLLVFACLVAGTAGLIDDTNWCLGTQSQVYNCSTAVLLGVAMEPR